MTMRIDAGWDFGKIGAFSLAFTDSGGTDVVTIASGQYCHTDISSVVSGYEDFATALQAELNGNIVFSGTYTVTYRPSNLDYRIQCTESFSTADPSGTVAGNILGLDGAVSSTTSKTSDVRPYYVISTYLGAKSNDRRGDYKPQETVQGGFTSTGAHYAIAASSPIVFRDFEVRMETKAALFSEFATSAVPFTWEHFWDHVGGSEPFLIADDVNDTVHYFRPEGAVFNHHEQVYGNYDNWWWMRFQTYVEGRL